MVTTLNLFITCGKEYSKGMGMEVEITIIIACAFIYLIAGIIDSIAGGGGLITTPALLLFNIPPHIALGSNKFASSFGSFAAIIYFLRNKYVALYLVPIGFCTAFLGGAIGSWLSLQIEQELMGQIMVILLPIVLLASLISGRNLGSEKDVPIKTQKVYVAFISLLVGIYDGFFGPATGSFFILALNVLLGMNLVRASGTTKVLNFATNIGALATFASGGVVLYALAIPCAIGSIIGNQIGSHLAVKIGAKVVRSFLYVALGLLFTTLIYKYILS